MTDAIVETSCKSPGEIWGKPFWCERLTLGGLQHESAVYRVGSDFTDTVVSLYDPVTQMGVRARLHEKHRPLYKPSVQQRRELSKLLKNPQLFDDWIESRVAAPRCRWSGVGPLRRQEPKVAGLSLWPTFARRSHILVSWAVWATACIRREDLGGMLTTERDRTFRNGAWEPTATRHVFSAAWLEWLTGSAKSTAGMNHAIQLIRTWPEVQKRLIGAFECGLTYEDAMTAVTAMPSEGTT